MKDHTAPVPSLHLFCLALAASLVAFVLALAPHRTPPPVRAMENGCETSSSNLITNGSMAPQGNGVAANWTTFVLTGDPTFEHANNEPWGDDTQHMWQDAAAYDAGLYQTVSSLSPGATYLFWLRFALAAYDPGTTVNMRGNWIGRQVGVDPTGGTDPNSSSVVWGSVYWSGTEAYTLDALKLSFVAQNNKATVYLRVRNTAQQYRNKAWLDDVCMEKTADAPVVSGTRLFLPHVARAAATATPTPVTCTPSVLTTVGVGTHPKGIAVDSGTNLAYVALFDSSSVAVVNASTNVYSTTWSAGSIGGYANGVGVTNGRVFVSLRDTNKAAFFDAGTGSLLGSVNVGSSPYGVGAANGFVWVANYDSSNASVINATTGSLTGNVTVGSNPVQVAATSDRAYVAYWGAGVGVVSSSGSSLANHTTSGGASFGVALNASTSRLYVSNRGSNVIYALNPDTGSTITSITLSQVPYGLAINPTTNHLFVLLPESNQVDVRDGSTLARVVLLSTGAQGENGGDGIGIVNGRVYISNYNAGTVSVIQDTCN